MTTAQHTDPHEDGQVAATGAIDEPGPSAVTLRVAPPSILGLYGFAAATFAVSANQAGWFGDDRLTPLVLFPSPSRW